MGFNSGFKGLHHKHNHDIKHNKYQSCDMLLIWFRHQRQPGPTELTEGTCVLSALGSAASVDLT